MISATTSLVIK